MEAQTKNLLYFLGVIVLIALTVFIVKMFLCKGGNSERFTGNANRNSGGGLYNNSLNTSNYAKTPQGSCTIKKDVMNRQGNVIQEKLTLDSNDAMQEALSSPVVTLKQLEMAGSSPKSSVVGAFAPANVDDKGSLGCTISKCALNVPTFISSSLLPAEDCNKNTPCSAGWNDSDCAPLVNENFLSAAQRIGTLMTQTKRNSVRDIRSAPPIKPSFMPWLMSSYASPVTAKELESLSSADNISPDISVNGKENLADLYDPKWDNPFSKF